MADSYLERIFDDVGAGAPLSDTEEQDYEQRVRALIEDARSYNDDALAPDREENDRYYRGEEPGLDEEGRSTIVATEVRDVVMAMIPSLIRIFTANEHPVEYIPTSEQTVELAEQATDYVSYLFWEDNDGFLIMHSLLKDALIKRAGITTWYTDVNVQVTEKHYRNLDAEQYQYLLSVFPDGEFINEEETEEGISVTVKITKKTDVTTVEAVPPDEFRCSRDAKSVRNATLIGRESLVPASKLVSAGYDRDMVYEHVGSSSAVRWSEERALRNPGLEMMGSASGPGNEVLYGEYFIRIDKDDDGIDELRKICTIGDDDMIINDEMVDRVKFAVFCPDPEPHTLIGQGIADLVKDLQKIKTHVLRASLDSLSQTIYPRTVVNQTLVDLDDAMNTELGAVIRTKGNPAETVQQLSTIFVGEPAFNMMNYLDQIRMTRTGISEASKGVDPKALQSTAVKGIDMLINGAQERIELVARVLCETGMKDMFKGLLQEVVENPKRDRMIKLRGKWVQVFPDAYDASMGVRVNPAVGRGSDMDRLALLSQVKQTQELIIEKFGPTNDMVSPIEYRNTMADILAIGNMRNVGRYFKDIDPKKLEAAAAAPPPPDPALIVAQNEQEKVRAATAKAVAEKEFKDRKLESDDQFRHRKLAIDAHVALSKITSGEVSAATTAITDMERDQQQREHELELENARQAADRVGEAGAGGASSVPPVGPYG